METEENASDFAFPLTNKSWQISILSPGTCRIMEELMFFQDRMKRYEEYLLCDHKVP